MRVAVCHGKDVACGSGGLRPAAAAACGARRMHRCRKAALRVRAEASAEAAPTDEKKLSLKAASRVQLGSSDLLVSGEHSVSFLNAFTLNALTRRHSWAGHAAQPHRSQTAVAWITPLQPVLWLAALLSFLVPPSVACCLGTMTWGEQVRHSCLP
jgi:hypothetical protein